MDIRMQSTIVTLALTAWMAGCDDGGSTETDTATDVLEEDVVADTALDETDVDDDASDATDTTDVLACELPDRTFWTWDLTGMPPGDKQVEAVCRGWGDNVAVYIEEAVWGVDIDEDDVTTIVETFESSTPADSERGIYDIVTGTFGDPPDVDSDPRIVLFYHSLGSYMGSSFDGFFRAQDEGMCSTCNNTEMLFLDAVHNPVAEPYMLSIIAHEFQHMIHWQADANEHSWINEAMSEAAMALCGYYTDDAHVRAFTFESDTSLVTTSHVDYGAEFLFGLYLYERLGETFLSELVAEPADGIPGFDNAASSYGVDMTTIFSDWVVANYLDDPDLADGYFGYTTYDTGGMAVESHSPDGVLSPETLNGWAADYNLYSLAGIGDFLTVRLDSTDWASLGVTIITFDSAGGSTVPVVTPFTLLDASTEDTITVAADHDRVVVVVFSLAEGTFSYEVSALW